MGSGGDFRNGPSTNEFLVRVWLFAAWAGVCVAVLSYLGVPEKLRNLRTPYAERPTFDASKDPKVGTTVQLPRTDVRGRDIYGLAAKADRVTLAVYGGCNDYTQRNSDPLMIPRTNQDLVIVVWMSPAETVRSRAQRYPMEFAVVADPEGVLARQLNAFWLPRLYLLDSRLRVLKCQQRGQAVEQWGKEE